MIEIETPRLWLRRFTLEDAEDFHALNSHPDVVRYVGRTPVKSIDEAVQLMTKGPLHDYASRGMGRLAAIDKASGRLIGFCGLKYVAEIDEVDLGYRLLPQYWGKGLANEAARAVLAHGREVLGQRNIVGVVDPANQASVRVLQKLAFIYEGRTRMSFAPQELHLYRLRFDS